MQPPQRRVALLFILALLLVPVLGLLFKAAGQEVALAAAIASLALVVTVYLGTGLLILRSAVDERAREFLRHRGLVPRSS